MFVEYCQHATPGAESDGLNVHYLDLLDGVRDIEPSKLWITNSDLHPNSYANEIFAGALFAKIRPIVQALR